MNDSGQLKVYLLHQVHNSWITAKIVFIAVPVSLRLRNKPVIVSAFGPSATRVQVEDPSCACRGSVVRNRLAHLLWRWRCSRMFGCSLWTWLPWFQVPPSRDSSVGLICRTPALRRLLQLKQRPAALYCLPAQYKSEAKHGATCHQGFSILHGFSMRRLWRKYSEHNWNTSQHFGLIIFSLNLKR